MATLEQVKAAYESERGKRKASYGDGTLIFKPGRRGLYGRIWIDGKPKDTKLATAPEHFPKALQVIRAAFEELKRLRYNDRERLRLTAAAVPERISVNQMLDAYFDELERRKHTGQKIEDKTIIDSKSLVNLHVRPHIGHLIAEQVAKNDIEKLRDTIASTPKERGKGKRSLPSIQAPLRRLKAAYRFALNDCDPPLISKMPQIKIRDEKKCARQGVFPFAEIPTILPFFDESTRVAIAVALCSGLRSIKELLNTRWEHVDLEAWTITVPPERAKNDEGRVSVLDERAVTMLLDAKRLRDEQFPNCPWVFYWHERRGRGQAGERMSGVYQQFKDAMAKAAKALNRPDLNQRIPHDCRRSFVTNESLAGTLQDKEIMNLSGHKDASVFGRYNVPSRKAAQVLAGRNKSRASGIVEAPEQLPPPGGDPVETVDNTVDTLA